MPVNYLTDVSHIYCLWSVLEMFMGLALSGGISKPEHVSMISKVRSLVQKHHLKGLYDGETHDDIREEN